MPLKANILGMVWEYPHSFHVGREQVRQFARSIKSMDPASHDQDSAAELGYDDLVAPPTFVSILALLIQQHFFMHVDVGLQTMQIVQVDQKFVYHKPIKAGDTLRGTMHVQSVNQRFGADIVVTRNICTDSSGDVVLEAFTTLMGHEGDNSISVKWDPETGQVIRKADGE